MRRFIVILVMINTFTVLSQSKKTTEITINNHVDKEEFVQMLIAHDNFVQDEKYGVITTVLRNSATKPNWSHQYHYRILFKENSIVIKPYWTMNINIDMGIAEAEAQLEKWKYSTKKNINGFIHQETIAMLTGAGYTNISYN